MIHALITIYHPSEAVKQNIGCIAQQVDLVDICDNSPASNHTLFADLESAGKLRYHFFGENLGISRAFNRVLKDDSLGWEDDHFVIFFDQDSQVEPGFVEKMISTFTRTEAMHPIGCMGSAYYNIHLGRIETPEAKDRLTEDVFSVTRVLTSSMLCRYTTLRSVDFWNEDVFLDMADWDLCWRIRASGKLCCLTDRLSFRHHLGIGSKKLGRLVMGVGHPFREYYQIREALYLIGRKYTPVKYRFRFLATLLIRSPLHLIFWDHRAQRCKYICKGIADFCKKKKGPLDL